MKSRFNYNIGDIVGCCTFNGQQAIKQLKSGRRRSYADFVCKCGNIFNACITDVKSLNTKSCGCLNPEVTGNNFRKHGLRNSLEYKSWCGMKERCYNSNNHKYKDYGGRGIIVCDRWRNSFENFYSDMGPKPTSKHSIDRFPDTNGDYEPINCRWGTVEQQSNNKRNSRIIEYNGIKKTVGQWSKLIGKDQSLISYHLKTKTLAEIINLYEAKTIIRSNLEMASIGSC